MSKPVEKAEGVPECEVLHGDCLEVLKGYPDEYFSACVTDPPYGLSKEPDVAEVMRHWLAGDAYEHGSNGFMGRSWDSFVPGPEYWREVYRTMKPGAHLLAFAGTRTWDLLSMAIRLAGFENRDTIRHHQGVPSLAWVFGSGFPKSTNISKHIDKLARRDYVLAAQKLGLCIPGNSLHDWTKAEHAPSDKWWEEFKRVLSPEEWWAIEREVVTHANRKNGDSGFIGGNKVPEVTTPATDAAKRWEGWHTSLKPAWEIILVFRKPLSASSVARQVLQNGCGALNVDASRIGGPPRTTHADGHRSTGSGEGYGMKAYEAQVPSGRFPSNFLLSHVAGPNGCQRVGTKRVRSGEAGKRNDANGYGGGWGGYQEKWGSYADPDGFEEVDSWECARDEAGNYVCPVALLDEQSGVSGERDRVLTRSGQRQMEGWGLKAESEGVVYGDRGGASRFFKNFEPDGMEEVEGWDCVEECPVAELNRQSGVRKSGERKPVLHSTERAVYGQHKASGLNHFEASEGGASRFFKTFPGEDLEPGQATGRFPSNLLLSHAPECERVGTKRVPNPGGKPDASEGRSNVYGWAKSGGIHKKGPLHAAPDGMEEVEEWECVEGCPVLELGRQSGTRKSGGNGVAKPITGGYGGGWQERPVRPYGDQGTASRFFAQFPGEPDAYCQETPESDNSDVLSSQNDDSAVFEPDTGLGFAYIPKASRAERNRGLEGVPEKEKKTLGNYRNPSEGRTASKSGAPMSNSHPTVKPLKLLKYLVRMVTPPGGTVLDCFAGSGTTGVACVEEGFGFVGIEAEEEYVAIARQRIAHAQAEASTRLPL